MNLGGFDARAGRDALMWGFDHWEGDVVVIHGELSDELPHYPAFQSSLTALLDRSRQAGFRGDEILGDDGGASEENQEMAIARWVSEHHIDPKTSAFQVTGAWYYPEDSSGCVGSVIDQLRLLGYSAEVHDSVLEQDISLEDEEEDTEGKAMDYPSSWPDELDEKLALAKARGFTGFGGECFAGTLAMAEALFPDQPVVFVGAFNQAFHEAGRSIGHVGIALEGSHGPAYLDADGRPKAWEDLESWGMLDDCDLDYRELADSLGLVWNEEDASTVVRVEMSHGDLSAMCNPQDILKCRQQWGLPTPTARTRVRPR